MKNVNLLILLITLFLLIKNDLSGQEAVKIKRITGHIEFDGIPKEHTWESVDIYPLTMHKPNFGTEPSEKSEVRIGYDDEFLWIGANLYMRDASKIFAVTKKRDDELWSCDAFGIILDTYKDNENGLAFFTAPTGMMTDYAISNDAVMNGGAGGNSVLNFSWNTFWDVLTTRDDKGWYIEMRIPFSSLKFKPVGDIATMGLLISRNISANNETDTYPSIDPKYGFAAPYKPSLAQSVKIEGAKPTKPVYVSPYLLGGFSQDQVLNESETEYVKTKNPQYNAGLDIKYNLNSNLTLDFTANTDFAQVEADAQQVNLTRYSLFFPEKRKFFQERSSLFDFNLGGQFDNLFYSRNIGITNGAPVRIYGGVRMTGRLGKWDMGLLDMQTAANEENPGENFAVLRMRRQVINQNSYVGGIVTSRMGMNGYQNLAYGVDGIFRLFGDDYLNIKLSQTYDSEIGNEMNSLNPSFILLDWERRSEKGFAYKLNYTFSGENFKPGTGFIMRSGVQGLSGRIFFGWLPGNESKFFSYNVSLNATQFNRLDDGKLESMQISPMFNLITKKGIFTAFSVEMQKEGVRNDFNLSDSILIKAGEYTFALTQVMVGTPNSNMISLMANLNAGQFYDGRRFGTMASLNFSFSSSFNLTAMYDFNAIRFPYRESNNSLNIHSVNLQATVMFSTKLSASLMLQHLNTQDDLITNFRLRYNPREGNDFYLVFNDSRNITENPTVPALPKFFNQTVMLKYIHTFILK